jgi:anti-sigma B factor antagonist/stage II sporulation protein AA (anti-sigma F factor antagonist)
VPRLSFETSLAGSTAVVALAGELDIAGAAALEHELAALDAGAVVVDLRGLGFMDSSGLRALVVAAQRAKRSGYRFALVPGAAHVMRVFDITRMRERLEFVADPREVTVGP